MWQISKENSQDLNFVLACLYSQSINIVELKLWIEEVIKSTPMDKIPNYIFELINFNESLFHITNIIGFVPHNDLSQDEEYALYGIAFLRNIYVYDSPVSKTKALDCLKKNHHIYEKFKKIFPFLNFSIAKLK